MGFIGAVVLLLIFLALIFHLIRLATKVESPFKENIYHRLCITTCFPHITKYRYDNPITTYYRNSTTIY